MQLHGLGGEKHELLCTSPFAIICTYSLQEYIHRYAYDMSSANDSTCWIYLLDWIDIRDNKRLSKFLIDIDFQQN